MLMIVNARYVFEKGAVCMSPYYEPFDTVFWLSASMCAPRLFYSGPAMVYRRGCICLASFYKNPGCYRVLPEESC